jgi:hypothetical protein
MNEEEFDASTQARPFGTVEVAKAEFQLRRSIALGIALWGKSPEDLQRQLVAPYPQIPSGFDLNDFLILRSDHFGVFRRFAFFISSPFGSFSSGYFRWCATVHDVGSPLRNSPPRD